MDRPRTEEIEIWGSVLSSPTCVYSYFLFFQKAIESLVVLNTFGIRKCAYFSVVQKLRERQSCHLLEQLGREAFVPQRNKHVFLRHKRFVFVCSPRCAPLYFFSCFEGTILGEILIHSILFLKCVKCDTISHRKFKAGSEL